MPRATLLVLGAVGALVAAACGGSALPDPKDTAREYAAAAARGDAKAVHALLTGDARRALGEEGTRRLLTLAGPELRRQAASVAAKGATVRERAEVAFVDGERATLDVDQGRFRVSSAAGLPSSPRTPSAALSELRAALSRRSYPGLLRVLSSDTRSAVEADMRSLVEGLDEPDSLDVTVKGEVAEVQVPGGHRVVLKREAGVWRVHDFD